MEQPSRKKNPFFTALLLFISFLLGIYLAGFATEIVFFQQHKARYNSVSLHVRQRAQEGAVKDKRLLSDYNNSLLHRIPYLDSALREYRETFNFRKKAAVFRILCIGGSTTRGVGVLPEESYPALLQQKLEVKAPGSYEVFNLGLQSANTGDFIARFYRASDTAEFGWRDLRPDLVIIAPLWNDLNAEVLESRISRFTGSLTWQQLTGFVKTHLSSRWALGHYIYVWLENTAQDVKDRHYAADKRDFSRRLDIAKVNFRKHLEKDIILWQAEKVKIYLMVFPCLIEEEWPDEEVAALMRGFGSRPESEYAFFSYRKYPAIQKADKEVISSIAQEYGVEYFDFSKLAMGMPAQKKADKAYFIDSIHLGVKLNEEIAGRLSDAVLAEKN